MAKYEIRKTGKALDIKIEQIDGQEAELLEAFGACQRGECSCPTDEYKKLDRMELAHGDDQIQIQLIAKADQELDVSEIERCLDYTTEQAAKKKS